uniref:Uncharacterized protein n=1 Tax=Knipowitschia caucasica TaxID=637954 RepID=A0AAV2JCV7_KNICA
MQKRPKTPGPCSHRRVVSDSPARTRARSNRDIKNKGRVTCKQDRVLPFHCGPSRTRAPGTSSWSGTGSKSSFVRADGDSPVGATARPDPVESPPPPLTAHPLPSLPHPPPRSPSCGRDMS